ncbi:hypothetical protein RUM43_006277 [Polyplax serrata]|uniref:Uncharacterized protein n=1 Tax=Polyplax serrata TaxID=468196 RepID=A0AAN8P153_POLSC
MRNKNKKKGLKEKNRRRKKNGGKVRENELVPGFNEFENEEKSSPRRKRGRINAQLEDRPNKLDIASLYNNFEKQHKDLNLLEHLFFFVYLNCLKSQLPSTPVLIL